MKQILLYQDDILRISDNYMLMNNSFLFTISVEYFLIDFNWSSLCRASEFILKEPRYCKGIYIILAIIILFYLIPCGDFWFGDLTFAAFFFCVNIFQEKSHSDAVAVCAWHFIWTLMSLKMTKVFFYYNARTDFHNLLSFLNLCNDNGAISHHHTGNSSFHLPI